MSRMISYAQNGEDVVLARAFKGRARGFYVDVGAYFPIADSVTKHFYELGWRGVNVEPVTSTFQQLAADRPGDVNLNAAVGSERGTRAFYEVLTNVGLSSFSRESLLAAGHGESELAAREIDVLPLRDLFAEHVEDREIDFLKIDVEGAEDEVLASGDWERWRPRVIVIEAPNVRREDILVDARYRKTLWDGLNTFWVREEDAEALQPALSYPAAVMDEYDPWLYVSQIQSAFDLAAECLETIFLSLIERPAPGEAAAIRAVARQYAVRPDLQAVFGRGPDLDARALFAWAAAAASDPALADELEAHTAVLEGLAKRLDTLGNVRRLALQPRRVRRALRRRIRRRA